jgi:hypothetical protein
MASSTRKNEVKCHWIPFFAFHLERCYVKHCRLKLKHDLGDGAELRILERRHAAAFLEFVELDRAHLFRVAGLGGKHPLELIELGVNSSSSAEPRKTLVRDPIRAERT